MKTSQIKQIIKEEIEAILKEQMPFSLGKSSAAEPDKPMEVDFMIAVNNPKDAKTKMAYFNEELKAKGIDPISYEYVGIIIHKPTYNQMNNLIKSNTFSRGDYDQMGRIAPVDISVKSA